jgi:LPXTG-site transpeptidase (sortase) family protein
MNLRRNNMKKMPAALTHVLSGVCYGLLMIGLLALGYTGFVFASSHAYQSMELTRFHQASRLSEPHVLLDGEVIGELQVPRLGLHAMVVEGETPANLRRAVAHLANSALPGERGNVVFAGHRDTFFRPLRDVRLGDEIRFTTRERDFQYRVESIAVVEPTNLSVLQSATGHDLTLLTCYPFHYVGPAPKRLVVRAREMDGKPIEQLAKN